ncbi:hypothetical protein [Microbacterium sp. NPDC087592]|uniref:hypothetical protein n=1 Tax=Microbacterium sp. NPDC087592 TaxID=3364193 RepID=UPI0037FAE8E9
MSMPRFELDLRPVADGDVWTAFDVHYLVDLPAVAAGETLLSIPEVVVSIPATPYRTEDLAVSDDAGPLVLTEAEPTSDSSGVYRHWVADRTTEGRVEVAFRAPVRPHDELTPVGPLFDLRAEELGLFGAGLNFLVLPGDVSTPDGPVFDFSLRWLLDEGVQAVSSYGTGDRSWSGPLQSVAFCYYAAGTPHRTPEGSGDFGIHSYNDTPFDLDEIGEYVARLHTEFTRFFEDEGSSYHVLIRKNLGQGTGGSAFPGSFAFAFSAVGETETDQLRSLLAHEMAHNWPTLNDHRSAISWYTEGTAEYYSHVLPHRTGILSTPALAAQLTDRFQQYDTNAMRGLDNDAASAAYWADPRAQRIPYGRGLRYLIATDGRIRQATDGEKTLDDVVLDILRAQRAGEQVGAAGWVERVAAFTGVDAQRDFDAMAAGTPIPLPDVPFEGMRAVPATAAEYDLGFDVASFRSDGRRVQGLRPDSAAARAGVRDGDALVDLALPYHASRYSDRPLSLNVVRAGEPLVFDYLPAGDQVATVRWEALS